MFLSRLPFLRQKYCNCFKGTYLINGFESYSKRKQKMSAGSAFVIIVYYLNVGARKASPM